MVHQVLTCDIIYIKKEKKVKEKKKKKSERGATPLAGLGWFNSATPWQKENKK
jgi:hypothetical protein